jgi:hypothetical protein
MDPGVNVTVRLDVSIGSLKFTQIDAVSGMPVWVFAG